MEFDKNKLMEQVINKYLNTWYCLVDSGDFVKEKYLDKIDTLIYKNLKKKLKEINVYYLLHLENQGVKLGIFQKISIFFSGLRPIYEIEQKKIEQKQSEKEKPKKAIKKTKL